MLQHVMIQRVLLSGDRSLMWRAIIHIHDAHRVQYDGLKTPSSISSILNSVEKKSSQRKKGVNLRIFCFGELKMGNKDANFWRKEQVLSYMKSTLLFTTRGNTAQRELMSMFATRE